MDIKTLVGLGILAIAIIWGVRTNNSLVGQEEAVNQTWAQVENQYQRRADLIPNLVNVVQGAADFEQETITDVIQARAQATSININPGDLNNPELLARFQQAQDQLSGALSRLLVTVERYPELRATDNFRDLQVQLEGTENRISTERTRFNQAAQEFNTSVRLFPTSLVAGLLGFESKAYFEATEGSEAPPEVSFD